MKFLIIGLGSMGQRRIRCLKALGFTDIWGYDENSETCMKAYKDYQVNVTFRDADFKSWVNEYKFDAVLVCVPPTAKQPYIDMANEMGVPVFCEADVMHYSGDYYPSRTLVYHPAIQRIKEFLKNDALGQVYTFTYHLGQHIRDWHKGANYKNYYAAKKKTGACKEMFVFEVAWLSWLLGEPVDAVGVVDKQLNDDEVTADDVYAGVVKFGRRVCSWKWYQLAYSTIYDDTISGTVLIDVVSRPEVRELKIIGEKGMLLWNWTKGTITLHSFYDDGVKSVIDVSEFSINAGQAAQGYCEHIPEQMYVDELKAFIDDIKEQANYTIYGYTPEDEADVVRLLGRVEAV